MRNWKAVLLAGASLALLAAAGPAMAGIPDLANSFYVPQAGTPDPFLPARGIFGAPTAPQVETEGTAATRFFRVCPNNDGGSSLPNNARVKVFVRDVNNNPIPNIAAADICILFNGGTSAQGFSGSGADSIIANSAWNSSPLCPNIRCIPADRATNSGGITYITFGGADPNNPGVTLRDPNRKWGHYDSVLPVIVLGFNIAGRLTQASAQNTYVLRIKNFDWTGGLAALANQGETVTAADFNGVANGINVNNTISYWRDFDYSGSVTATDFNTIALHTGHDCDTPNNP